MSRSNASTPRGNRQAGAGLGKILLTVVLWLTVGLLPLLFGVGDVRLAFGLVGEPGKATVERCADYNSGADSYTECRGTFRPDDRSRPAVENVRMPPETDEGETFTARLRPDGDSAGFADLRGKLGSLALPALGVLFLVPMPWGLAYLFGRRPGRLSLYAMAVPAAGAAALCVVGLMIDLFV
ncbi:hypothetical protein [Actinomadura sp. 6N118]|uniref:hypothetical protein n=1 Tax=Actinomadura sp. 6N118 TaxID=3375151 RepID=UPI0037A857A5